MALYHVVFEKESFEDAAQMIFDLIRNAQKSFPNVNRILYLDIDGHRNKMGGFDHDMLELQKEFMLGFLLPYLHEVCIPLGRVKNSKLQRNDLPDEFMVSSSDEELIKQIKDKNKRRIFEFFDANQL